MHHVISKEVSYMYKIRIYVDNIDMSTNMYVLHFHIKMYVNNFTLYASCSLLRTSDLLLLYVYVPTCKYKKTVSRA